MLNVLVFDIETIPDLDGLRELHDAHDLDDASIAELAFHERRALTGGEFLKHHCHRICAISAVLRSADKLQVWSLGQPDSPEDELVRRFFDGVERFKPTLVSWNGGTFDLPVLHYRALIHGIAAPAYWDTGQHDAQFRYNNYLSRYHQRHTDLMDVLSGYQPRASASLDELSVLCGFPGKLGMSGAKVFQAWMAGDIEAIRNYCETDVLNTYLLYLRYELMRGNLDGDGYDRELTRLRAHIETDGRAHMGAFLEAWAAATDRLRARAAVRA